MNIIDMPSPNHDSREGQQVDMLVLHYTGMPTAKQALERLRGPSAKVSAHYVVDEDGTVYRMVPEEQRAWHAGVSSWRGNSNINARSIGIEIINPGHEFGYRAFPKAQMAAVVELCKEIVARHAITPRNVVGHSDVAPERKEDPGELFDWKFLAGQGVGIWPFPHPNPLPEGKGIIETLSLWERVGERSDAGEGAKLLVKEVQEKLREFGYAIEPADDWNEQARKVVIAFQRRFRPSDISGEWDAECLERLLALCI